MGVWERVKGKGQGKKNSGNKGGLQLSTESLLIEWR